MIYSGQQVTRNLLSESDSRRMAKKYGDNNFRSTDLSVLCEAYNKIPLDVDRSLIKEHRLNKYDKMALILISEQANVHPEDVLLEFWKSVKKLGKKIGAAIASPVRAVQKAKKGRDQGATMWQSVKYGMTELPQLFKHGTHFGQGKASEEANAAYEKILSDFANHSNKRLKELTAAAKELQQSDFPNNARPEDFRMMLMGKEKFADIESQGLGGLLGAMLDIRQSQQEYVNNGGDLKIANEIIGRMRKMLQFYMGELHDTYQSLESRNRYRQPLIRNSTSVALLDLYYDNDYWYGKVCEGMFDKNGLLLEKQGLEDAQTQDVDSSNIMAKQEDQEALAAAVEGKSEQEIHDALMGDEGLEGLSDKHLKSMVMASSAMRPILLACLGAAISALGINMGGNALGNFEESQAFADMMSKLEGKGTIEFIKETPAVVGEYMTIDVQPGEGITQVFGRLNGLSPEAVQDMSMKDFLAGMKETGMNAESMGNLMSNPEEGFKFMQAANPDLKVGEYLRGVVEIQNMEGAGVSEKGHELMTKLFNMSDEQVANQTMGGFFEKGSFSKGDFQEMFQKQFPGSIGAGKNPLSLVQGVGPTITKVAAKAATKMVIKKTVGTFAAGKVSSMVGAAALPTIIATAGVGIATSGIAIAALRKFAKNRKKTIMAAIDLLEDIKGPMVGSPAANPPDNGPIDEPDGDSVQGLADELPLDLFNRSLEDKGYDDADELADEMFQDEKVIAALVQDTPPKPQSLTAGYRRELQTMTEEINRWNHLAGLNEDLSFEDFASITNSIAKDAGLPELDGEQLGIGAQALNVTRGIGDITNLPGPFAKEEFENKIDELEKLIESMKLENNESVRGMLDTLASKVGLDPSNYKDLENDEYMAKLGETWNNDQAAWEDAMDEIDALESQLAAANAGLDEAESKLAAANEELNKYIEENSSLIQDNEELKKAVEDAAKLAAQKDIVIGSLSDTIKQKDEINALKDEEISDLTSKLDEANRMIEEMKMREDELNSRLIDLRKLYLALSKASGSNKTTYDRKHDQKRRNKTFTSLADSFEELGDEFPALRDTGKIIRKSMEAGVNSSVQGSGQLKKGGGRNEPAARSKKEESSWRKGDLILEKLDSLIGFIQEGSDWYDDHHETLADKKFADAQQADQVASQMRDPENLLDDLEMGREVQMSEEELQAVQELCRREGLMDYVFEIQNYKNMQIVKLLDDYDDWNQPY